MGFDFTPAQNQAIHNRGALLVSAAAGSGKTAVLVERVVTLVLDPAAGVDIDRLLVVTFTKAAAAEMRQRIRERLMEKQKEDPLNPRLIRQLILLEKADICTIDSFCNRLVSEYFQVLGVSSDFRLISEDQLAILKNEAMEETLDRLAAEHPREFAGLEDALGDIHKSDNLKSALVQIDTHLCAIPAPEGWLKTAQEEYLKFTSVERSVCGQRLLKRAADLLTYRRSMAEELLPTAASCDIVWAARGHILQEGMELMKAAEAAARKGDWDAVYDLCHAYQPEKFTTLKKGADPQAVEASKAVKGIQTGAVKSVNKLFTTSAKECAEQCRTVTPHVLLLLQAAEIYRQIIEEKKQKQNALSFSDLEILSLRLLGENKDGKIVPSEYARAMGDRFDYVMVDEFQDVNDLQDTIFHLLSDNGNKLFAVGDVKQSIYGFRQANPKNFTRMLDEYPAYQPGVSPAKLVLDGNFRSRKEICQWINGLFRALMSRTVGEVEYDRSHELAALSDKFAPCPEPAVEMDFLQSEEDRSDIELEADCIAGHIRHAMTVPCISRDNTLVPAKPSDCVILLRSKKDMNAMAARLQAHGIPAFADQGEDFLSQPEIAHVVSLLRVIDNPTDDVSLLACMMSPLFGFTADEMAGLRAENRKMPLYLSVENAAAGGDGKARQMLTCLQELRTLAVTLSSYRLILAIYDRFGYPAAVQVTENGAARKANLLSFIQLAKDCETAGYERLDGLMRYLRKLEDGSASLTAATAAGEGVHLITIHYAKGLQFPICFVAQCGKQFNQSDSKKQLMIHNELGVGLSYCDAERIRHSTCFRNAIQQEAERNTLSEEMRLLYVAATRAVDRLILITTFGNRSKAVEEAGKKWSSSAKRGRIDPEAVMDARSFGSWLSLYAAGNPETAVYPAEGSLPTPEEILAQALPEPPREPEVTRAVTDRLTAEDAYAPLRQIFSKRSVSQLVHEAADTDPIFARPAFLQEGGLTAAEKGTALHTFMQYADYERAAQDAAEEVERLTERQFLTPAQAANIPIEKLQRFFAGELYRRMQTAITVLREHRFMGRIPATRLDPSLPERFADESIVIQGIADCIFEEPDGLVILDYKTDRVRKPEELAERYGDQLKYYAQMLSETTGKPIKERVIYSFALDQAIPLD